MKTNLYFRKINHDYYMNKKDIIDTEKFYGAKKGDEITVFEARKVKRPMFRYCVHNGVIEVGICGRDCEIYEPRNGKSGCCKFLGKLYEPGDKVTIIID